METREPAPLELPELEDRPGARVRTYRDIESDLARRRDQHTLESIDKPADTLRAELRTLTRQAADSYRSYMKAFLEVRAKTRDGAAYTGQASRLNLLKANFLILLVQDHCRALHRTTGAMDPAIEEAVRTLAPLGVTFATKSEEGKLTMVEIRTHNVYLFSAADDAKALRAVRKEIADAPPGTDLAPLREREARHVAALAERKIATDDASLTRVIEDLTLSAAYLDVFGGSREPPQPPQQNLEEPVPLDKRPDAALREEILADGRTLKQERRTYLTAYLEAVKGPPETRALSVDSLLQAQYRSRERLLLRGIMGNAREMTRRYNACPEGERAARKEAFETLARELRPLLAPLGYDFFLTIHGKPPNAEFDRTFNLHDDWYMGKFVDAMERLVEVRRQLTAPGLTPGEAETLRKEEAELASWTRSLDLPAEPNQIADTLAQMRLTRDFYNREPFRAARNGWGSIARGMLEDKEPSAAQVAELNWALSAIRYVLNLEEMYPGQLAEKEVNRITAEANRLGFRVVREQAATQAERDSGQPYRSYKLRFVRIILNDERNEAEEMLEQSRMAEKIHAEVANAGPGEGFRVIRAYEGRDQAREEQKALNEFLAARRRAGELPPQRVLSHRMHAVCELLTRTWIHPSEPEVQDGLKQVAALSVQLLSDAKPETLDYIQKQLDVINGRLLEFGLEMLIGQGEGVRFITLSDPLPTARVQRTFRGRIRETDDPARKNELEAAKARFERRVEDLKLIGRFLDAGKAWIETPEGDPAREERTKAYDEVRRETETRIEALTDYAERTRFLVRLGSEAGRMDLRTANFGGTLSLDRRRPDGPAPEER